MTWRCREAGMKKTLLKNLKRDGGYTLLELLVVLTILGLLTMMATPYVIRYIESGRVRTARTEVPTSGQRSTSTKVTSANTPTRLKDWTRSSSSPPAWTTGTGR